MLPQSLKLRSWAFRLAVGGFGLLNGVMVLFRALEVTNPWLCLPATVSILLGIRALRSGLSADGSTVVLRGVFRTVRLPLAECRFRSTQFWTLFTGVARDTSLVVTTPRRVLRAWMINETPHTIAHTVAQLNARAAQAGRRRPDAHVTPAGLRTITRGGNLWVLQPEQLMLRALPVLVLGAALTAVVADQWGWRLSLGPVALTMAGAAVALRHGLRLSGSGELVSCHGFSTARWERAGHAISAQRDGAGDTDAWLEVTPAGEHLSGLRPTDGNERQVAAWLNHHWS